MITREGNALRIEGEVTLATMGELLPEARRLMLPEVAAVDVGGVTEADSSLVALLLDLVRTAQVAGRPLAISRPTAGLASLAGLYGVDALLFSDR